MFPERVRTLESYEDLLITSYSTFHTVILIIQPSEEVLEGSLFDVDLLRIVRSMKDSIPLSEQTQRIYKDHSAWGTIGSQDECQYSNGPKASTRSMTLYTNMPICSSIDGGKTMSPASTLEQLTIYFSHPPKESHTHRRELSALLTLNVIEQHKEVAIMTDNTVVVVGIQNHLHTLLRGKDYTVRLGLISWNL